MKVNVEMLVLISFTDVWFKPFAVLQVTKVAQCFTALERGLRALARR